MWYCILTAKKKLSPELIKFWSENKKPLIKMQVNTRSGVILPIMTSHVAERSLTKNLYTLAVSNKANVYREEDLGFPVTHKIDKLRELRETITDCRPGWDVSCFFIVNGYLFMIDHGERTGRRAAWQIAKYVTKDELAGIFVEQLDEGLDLEECKCPIFPLSYGIKQPEIWINQHLYHDLGLNSEKKYSVSFMGKLDRHRKSWGKILNKIPDSKIVHKGNNQRMEFDEYMQEITASHICWCPPGNRPKTHREVEAMCCEVAVMMPRQAIVETEPLIPNIHYIEVAPDHHDVADKCNYYLQHLSELKEIAHNGRLWFERNTSDSARAHYMYKSCLHAIGAGTESARCCGR